jgi:hypothetical protein
MAVYSQLSAGYELAYKQLAGTFGQQERPVHTGQNTSGNNQGKRA